MLHHKSLPFRKLAVAVVRRLMAGTGALDPLLPRSVDSAAMARSAGRGRWANRVTREMFRGYDTRARTPPCAQPNVASAFACVS
ncbi:unnamed protein product, partial [Iphiclides podalirius]